MLLQATCIKGSFSLRLLTASILVAVFLLTPGHRAAWSQSPEKGESPLDNGRALIHDLGCVACHEIKDQETAVRSDAPNLTYEGEIVRRDWLFAFLRKPHGIRPAIKARMPDLRLTDRETLAITEYLASLVDGEAVPQEFRYPRKLSTEEVEAAKKLVSKDYFDCFNCHILGDKKPTGKPEEWAPDLTRLRSRMNPDFPLKWLRNPDKYRPGTKMPAFFPDKDSGPDDILGGDEMRQMAAIRDYLMSIGKAESFPEYAQAKARFADVTPSEGRALMVRLNCVGCHEVGVLPQGKKVGPNLTYEGSRVRKEWLIGFLRAPHTIKPEFALMGSPTRMPTFSLTVAETLAVAEYVSQVLVDKNIQQDGGIDPSLANGGRRLFKEKTCDNCHRIGSSPGGIGPDLTAAGERLRSGWVIKFIQQPEHYLETRMPNLKLSPEEARALAAYVLGPKN